MNATTLRPQRPIKTVKIGVFEWTIISANERSTSHNGRHFFACRCSPKHYWSIDEMSQSEWNGSKLIGRVGTALQTSQLSECVYGLTKSQVPA